MQGVGCSVQDVVLSALCQAQTLTRFRGFAPMQAERSLAASKLQDVQRQLADSLKRGKELQAAMDEAAAGEYEYTISHYYTFSLF